MDYIILNNKNSKSIKGLLISTLPPISKPPKRVEIEEINGIDGSNIIELGYGAYDKEFEIGLTYNYNIDEIIEFFDSEGIVTFSNEPDKYYKYKIVNQIDFTKLLRFKTATVTINVQPFKYSVTEQMLEYADEDFSSNEIIIDNKGNTNAKPIFTIYGEGEIAMYLNDNQVFKISLGDEEYITIDIEKMEAYKDSILILKNRLVAGNYDNFKFNVGANNIHFSGTVTRFEISNYSRWL